MEDWEEYHIRIEEIKEAIKLINESLGAMHVPEESSIAKPFSELTFRLSNNVRDASYHLTMLEEYIEPFNPIHK